MDYVVIQSLFFFESVQIIQEFGEVGVEFSHRRFRLASLDVNNPDVGADGLDAVGDASVLTGEDIDLHTHIAKGCGQLPHIYVHTPRLPLSRGRQGAGVEGDECSPRHAQLFFTTI